MPNELLVISSSLSPESRSRLLARTTYEILSRENSAEFVDLRDFELPHCDGDASYSHPSVKLLSAKIQTAKCIVLGVPIYNYAASSVAKNLIEMTGNAWNEKIVGFLCAAGGKSSYMSVMGLANSLMLDFRCLIIPRFVYADGSAFKDDEIIDEAVTLRIQELADTARKLAKISLSK